LELATIVFDESNTSVDNLVSRILFNSIFLLECQKCQVYLFDSNSIEGDQLSRSSLTNNKHFNRVYELSYDDLSKTDAFSHGILVKPVSQTYPVDSAECRIIESVVNSGEILNIQNLADYPEYSNIIFNNSKVSTLLCIPVLNSSYRVVALIVAYNKIESASLDYFSRSDINVAKAFGLFCGIGIHNIMM
jgi:GAF domain-containing protein